MELVYIKDSNDRDIGFDLLLLVSSVKLLFSALKPRV